MFIDELRSYCLSFPHTKEALPFDQNTLVFYVDTKMFCLTNIDGYDGFNVKCEPEKAIELREIYSCVLPGYHMNKKHWNTIKVDGSVSDLLLKDWIKHSYELVWAGISIKRKKELNTY